MNELTIVDKATEWRRMKSLVLDSVRSPITKRVYSMALDEFFDWYRLEPRPGFSKATVNAWRVTLDERGLGSSSIIVRMSAIRQQAVVGGLHRQLANGRHSDDDRGRSQASFVKRYAPGVHRGFGKSGPRLQPVPIEELIQGHGIDPFRDGRPDGVEHEALPSAAIRSLCQLGLSHSFCASYWAISVAMKTLPREGRHSKHQNGPAPQAGESMSRWAALPRSDLWLHAPCPLRL